MGYLRLSFPSLSVTYLLCLWVITLPLQASASNDKSKSPSQSGTTNQQRIQVAPPSALLTAQGDRLMQIEKLALTNPKQASLLANEFNQSPLEAFAHFQWLKAVVADTQYAPSIVSYIQQFSDTSWANQLTQRWSEQLELRQDWLQLISYQDQLTQGNARCAVLSAQLATGFLENNAWLAESAQLWLADTKISPSCAQLYQRLENSQLLTESHWKAKLKQLYTAGRFEEVNRKQPLMPESIKHYSQQVSKMLSGDPLHNGRQLIEQSARGSESNTDLLSVLIRNSIKQNPNQALVLWKEAKGVVKFPTEERHKIERLVYAQLAKSEPDQRLQWLVQIDASAHDESTLLPLLHEALRSSDWELLIKLTQDLPSDLSQDTWTYWRARAFMQTNQAELAQPLWDKLASQRSYYGFMAADQLGKDYKLNSQQVTADQLVNAHQSVLGKRLQALYEVGLKDVAWREWLYARNSQKVSNDAVPGYAQLAQSLGWHSFAVLALGKPEHWNYTHLRFAMPYQDLLRPNAEQHNISLAWAYGIMRRESAYAHDVKSTAGAMGLMQLMPKTAQALAPIQQLKDVYQPELNVKLGTKLLGQLKREFNGNLVLATASYNAGGFRVKQWIKRQPDLPTDQWIELIPFKETRDYVKAVMEFMLVFERKGLSQTPSRLADYLQPINTQLATTGKQCNPDIEWCL